VFLIIQQGAGCLALAVAIVKIADAAVGLSQFQFGQQQG